MPKSSYDSYYKVLPFHDYQCITVSAKVHLLISFILSYTERSKTMCNFWLPVPFYFLQDAFKNWLWRNNRQYFLVSSSLFSSQSQEMITFSVWQGKFTQTFKVEDPSLFFTDFQGLEHGTWFSPKLSKTFTTSDFNDLGRKPVPEAKKYEKK